MRCWIRFCVRLGTSIVLLNQRRPAHPRHPASQETHDTHVRRVTAVLRARRAAIDGGSQKGVARCHDWSKGRRGGEAGGWFSYNNTFTGRTAGEAVWSARVRIYMKRLCVTLFVCVCEKGSEGECALSGRAHV